MHAVPSFFHREGGSCGLEELERGSSSRQPFQDSALAVEGSELSGVAWVIAGAHLCWETAQEARTTIGREESHTWMDTILCVASGFHTPGLGRERRSVRETAQMLPTSILGTYLGAVLERRSCLPMFI